MDFLMYGKGAIGKRVKHYRRQRYKTQRNYTRRKGMVQDRKKGYKMETSSKIRKRRVHYYRDRRGAIRKGVVPNKIERSGARKRKGLYDSEGGGVLSRRGKLRYLPIVSQKEEEGKGGDDTTKCEWREGLQLFHRAPASPKGRGCLLVG
jgi:hypothetical protein